MIEYKIVKTWTHGSMAVEIEEHLNNGWKLAGDLRVIGVHEDAEFFQALTKGNPNA